jgi:NRPS condensation-like uncharacterized protein
MSSIVLEPRAKIERPLSISEYFFASLGSSNGPIKPQNITLVLEGEGDEFSTQRWQEAVDLACDANPGTRLRMVGQAWRARWINDGLPARLRIVERTDWDGQSDSGADFIEAEPLPLDHGPTVELILVNRSPRGRLVVIRASHAVMDGRGAVHFLKEVFRALRREPLLGSNAGFSVTDLMRTIPRSGTLPRHQRTDWLTGPPQGDEEGSEWRRIQLPFRGRNALASVAALMAEYAHRHSDRPARFAIPVDMRRHVPGLLTTANFTGMVFVALLKGEGADDFQRRLDTMLEERLDSNYMPVQNIIRLFRRSWLDRLAWRLAERGRKGHPPHTAMISNLGRIKAEEFSCEGFTLRACFLVPTHDGMSSLVGMGDRVELALKLPRRYSSNGRFDDFIGFMRRRAAR